MRPLRGLTIVVAEGAAGRLRTALNLALAAAALGARVRIFLDVAAVAIVRLPIVAGDDEAYVAAGLPALETLHAEALDAGVGIALCQSGMAMAGTRVSDYDPRVEFGGMVALLAELGDDRLVVV